MDLPAWLDLKKAKSKRALGGSRYFSKLLSSASLWCIIWRLYSLPCSFLLAAQDIVAGTRGAISGELISLEIQSPDVPDLTLIDLPGIARVAVGNQPKDIGEQVKLSLTTPSCAQGHFCNLPHMWAFAVGHWSYYAGLLRQQESYANKQTGLFFRQGIADRNSEVKDLLSALSCRRELPTLAMKEPPQVPWHSLLITAQNNLAIWTLNTVLPPCPLARLQSGRQIHPKMSCLLPALWMYWQRWIDLSSCKLFWSKAANWPSHRFVALSSLTYRAHQNQTCPGFSHPLRDPSRPFLK